MPFTILKHGKCYSVVNTKTNKLHSRCSTLANAKKQERLLRAIEHGFHPTGRGLKRKVGLYPPSMRKLLKEVGSETVKSLKVVRTPIAKSVKGLLDLITLGQYDKAVKEAGYDNMLHLALFINEKYQLDKQAVVVFKKNNPISPDSEVMDVVVFPEGITIQSLIDKTKSYMGDENFSNYDAQKNNCQDFILAVLGSNGLLNAKLRKFIKQDAESVFKKLPEVSEKIAKVFTDTGAVVDKIIEGEKIISHNNKMTRKTNPWLVHLKSVMAKNKGKSLKECMKLAKLSYKR